MTTLIGTSPAPLPGRDERRVAIMLAEVPEHLREDVRCWVAALRGEGRRPSPALGWQTVRVYLTFALPVLQVWGTRYGSLRAVTRADVEAAIRAHSGKSPHNVHTALRSLFRGLKRERRIFTGPAAGLVAHFARWLPRPLPADRLRGLLDRLDHPRVRLIAGLVAVHALGVGELQAVRLDDLDRARGTLQIRRSGSVFTPVLDELITGLMNDWLRTRATRCPHEQPVPARIGPHREGLRADEPLRRNHHVPTPRHQRPPATCRPHPQRSPPRPTPSN